VGPVLSILEQHGRKAWVIGKAIEDPTKGVERNGFAVGGGGIA
jgi:hypothetical protein